MNPALSERSSARVRPDASWTTMMHMAAREVFQLMVNSDVQVCANPPERQAGKVSAMVGMAGLLCAIFRFRCAEESAISIAKKMLGVQKIDNPSEAFDAMGEVCNMLAGNFKAKISVLADGCLLSVPTVVTGEDYDIRSLPSGEHLEVCLEYEGKPMWVTLEISG